MFYGSGLGWESLSLGATNLGNPHRAESGRAGPSPTKEDANRKAPFGSIFYKHLTLVSSALFLRPLGVPAKARLPGPHYQTLPFH